MQATEHDFDLATTDLGPLAWVLEELRKSLAAASAALRRFVRDTALARGEDMASVDDGQLRIARQQLHQAVGALDMVGQGGPAHVLRSMEAAVQKFIDKPGLCTEAAAAKVERAGFALTDYLEALLLGKRASPVALFPQYRETQDLAGADRIHPADLWAIEWRWEEPATPPAPQALDYSPAVRSRLDADVLRLMKSGEAGAAREVAAVSLGLAASQSAREPRIFWQACAGFFEALALKLVPLDIFVKRAATRVLLQYAALAKGDLSVSERAVQDLLFFCAQAVPAAGSEAPSLSAVRRAWRLDRYAPVDYETAQYGRFDPAVLAHARKRIAAGKDAWSALSGGDVAKLKGLPDQFRNLGDSLLKLYPVIAPLSTALSQVVEGVVRAGRAPDAELAMEVATAVLYLEAALQDLDVSDASVAERATRLAQRLDTARQGGQAGVLEAWMEELYRRVSDRQTMGSVVSELRGTLGELEKLLDQFFREPADKAPLREAPSHLSQMRGVLSVLGLDQAAQAVARMRESVEEIMLTDAEPRTAGASGVFEKLGNNVGALGFLIDMLNYQPALAKKLFVYDDARAELRPLMGRAGLQDVAPTAAAMPDRAEPAFAAAAAPRPAAQTPPPLQRPATHEEPAEDDGELLEIFLDEAREVVRNGQAALQVLAVHPAEVAELTVLRRAFHTLKGSSRMVGLTEFGEAAWSMEQVLNTWLADQKPAGEALLMLAGDALQGFARWVEDVAGHADAEWKSSMFRGPADALRTENRLASFAFPPQIAPVVPDAAAAPAVVGASATVPPTSALEESMPPPVSRDFEPIAPDTQGTQAQPPSGLDAEVALPHVQPGSLAPSAPVAEAPTTVPHEGAGGFELPEFELDPEPAQVAQAQAAIDVSAGFEVDLASALDADRPAGHPDQPTPATPMTVEAIDLDSLAELAGPAVPREADAVEPAAGIESVEAPMPEADFAAFGLDLPVDEEQAPGTSPLPHEAAAEAPSASDDEPVASEQDDEQVKVIGPLRIGIPLYNVYLNEADEWSRRLATEIGEWCLELDRPIADSTVGLAHALGGSSATVGFHELSRLARALEAALQKAQWIPVGTDQHARAFSDAAEEIRRLLHQFAAGFLKDANPAIADALEALEEPPITQTGESTSGFGPSVLPPLPPAKAQEPPVVPQTPFAAARGVQPGARAPIAPASLIAQSPLTPALDEQEELEVADAVDADLFPIFDEEARELVPQLGGALRQWAARPDNRSARDEVLRALHTLKGSARLAGALRLGELAHLMESHVEALGWDREFAPGEFDPLLQRFDGLQANLDAVRAVLTRALQAAAEQAAVPSAEPTPAVPAAAMPAEPSGIPAAHVPPQRTAAMVRVRSELLDRLVNRAGEVTITRSRLEAEVRQLRASLGDLTGNLDRLRAQLRDIELQAESQMQSRLAQARDSAQGFDPLEFDRFTRVQELTRMMAESVNDVATVQRNLQRTVEATEDNLVEQARQTRELQRDLLRTRMVEFESISDRLYRVVRLASKETGKQVKLDITGGTIEMDRGVLDRMTPAFEHLLRNCVAHGVEMPVARAAAGKDATGTVLINLHQEGNDVSVEFRDDGAGMDLPAIRRKAVEQGLIAPGQQLSDREAANLVFVPGFSTAAEVTELAGRGIGMDVVRADVNALGGRIETSTTAGQGTTFKLVLPLTTAVTQVVMIRCGNLTIGVPAHLVEIVRRATAAEIAQAYESGLYELGSEQLPFHWSGALLQASAASTEPPARTMHVVVVRSAAQRIAMHVDEVLGNQEVVVKNLGPQLARLPGLAGMTVLASGAVVLIYNPVALSTVYGAQARQLSARALAAAGAKPAQAVNADRPQAPDGAAERSQIPLVLVVDDSITVRRVTQRLLQREGYRVALAADGLQALERLAEEVPAVVLSDIEMPRMDGFDLARNIRGDERLQRLPIVMITSRIAEKHREHAKQLGVDHYLGKPYSEEELLSLVRHYAAAAIA